MDTKNKYKDNYKEKIDITTDPRFQISTVITKLQLKRVYTRIPSNGNLIYQCIFCGDSKNLDHGHLYIDLSKNAYKCTKCGESGFALSLYAKAMGIDNSSAFKDLMGYETNKKERKQIYNLKVIEKEIKENKKDENLILAGIKRRDIVYRAFLNELSLSDYHRDNLLMRGISSEDIKEIGYKTLPKSNLEAIAISYRLIKNGHKLSGIPGFYKDKENKDKWTFKSFGGYLIPALDEQNRIQAFQVRRFVKKGKYIWLSSAGEKDGTATETFINFTSFDRSKPFVIVEGTLKSQICAYLKPSANYIGIPGTNAIKYLLNALVDLNIKTVIVAFDMDKLTNEYVIKAEDSLKKQLNDLKINYTVFDWDINKGKGLDDFLLNVVFQTKKVVGEYVYCE